jgi:cytochrome oxidase Cu insertion factor (SCO1/SenC/PrrC family)
MRRFVRAAALASISLLPGIAILAAARPAAFDQAQTTDPQTLGPKIGERVPDFSLPDQHGTTRTLRSTFGPKGAVLVFYRSADW